VPIELTHLYKEYLFHSGLGLFVLYLQSLQISLRITFGFFLSINNISRLGNCDKECKMRMEKHQLSLEYVQTSGRTRDLFASKDQAA